MQTDIFSMSTPAAYAAMAAMLGRPITRCPPARACALSDADIWDMLQSPPRPAAPRGGDLVVLAVHPRPYRFKRKQQVSKNYVHFVVGRTLAQVLAAGCSRRAVNRARAEGWLVLGHRPSTKET